MKSIIALTVATMAVQDTNAARLKAEVQAKTESQFYGYGGMAGYGGCGYGRGSVYGNSYGYGSYYPSYGYGGCGYCGGAGCGACGYGGFGGWGGYGGYGNNNWGNQYAYVPHSFYGYQDNSLRYNRGLNYNDNVCLGPIVQQGPRIREYLDDSDTCTNVCEQIISPETTIVRENNAKFGGNFQEIINKENTNAAVNQVCKECVVPIGREGCINTVTNC